VPWLFRIARNKAKDIARHRRARPVGEALGEDLIDPADGASSQEEVERLVASLKPPLRSLVLLRAVQGWSAEEVAAALGTSPSTVRRRYARALRHLRERHANGGRDG
jgi:RNA polymerase sigma-70 factor (ECF subfamily)